MTDVERIDVIGAKVDCLSWEKAICTIQLWANSFSSRVICICNAHSLVTAHHDDSFRNVLLNADLITPDGASVAALMRLLGEAGQQRINGPDLMIRYCEAIAGTNESIYLYGSTEATLAALIVRLKDGFPSLRIAGHMSPPFRALSKEEDAAAVEAINSSGAGTVWISLGCPKQEKWMLEHKGRIHAVMIGVGAAFDYHAGVIKRAPLWMQNSGLEWLHRLISEPRRLWRRYFFTNTEFLCRGFVQYFVFLFRGRRG